MMKITFAFSLLLLFSCGKKERSIEDAKLKYGDFENQTIKLLPVDYAKAPINRAVKNHPENYTYLEEVDIYSIGHRSEGLFITGFLVRPKEAGNYPVIVFNRGGNRDLGMLLVASAVNIMAPLAAKGYVVVASNYRGNSGSEGQEEFGGADVNDVKNLIQSLSELPFADNSRVGLLGISRGGMMNLLSLKGNEHANIKAVVNVGGITDLGRTIEHHPEIGFVASEIIPNFHENKKQELQKRSAVYWSNELPKTAPILLLHSVGDEHVHYSQIPPFADSLELHRVPFKLVSFENDNHGLLNHKSEVQKMVLQWFDDYLKNKGDSITLSLREQVH